MGIKCASERREKSLEKSLQSLSILSPVLPFFPRHSCRGYEYRRSRYYQLSILMHRIQKKLQQYKSGECQKNSLFFAYSENSYGFVKTKSDNENSVKKRSLSNIKGHFAKNANPVKIFRFFFH